MHLRHTVTIFLSGAALFLAVGASSTAAQSLRVEAGGGWAIPSSSVDMVARAEGERLGTVAVDLGSGAHVYASAGFTWTISSSFSIGARLRAQQSRMSGDSGELTARLTGCGTGACEVSNEPDGRLRGITVGGRLTLTSAGRVRPYFLVGLGVVRTTVDAVRVTTPDGEVQFSEVDVTDAGGDVGFGATTRIAGRLRLTAETRVTGSLPGAKENAVTTFPFTLGVSYEF